MKKVIFALSISGLFFQAYVASAHSESQTPNFKGKRAYAVWTSKFKLLKNAPESLVANEKYTIVKLNSNQVNELSHVIHKTGTCGGFFDLENDVQGFIAPNWEKVLNEYSNPPEAFLNDVPSSAKYSYAVKKVLRNLSKTSYETFLKQMTSVDNRFSRNQNGEEASRWLKDQLESLVQKSGRSDVEVRFVEASSSLPQKSVLARIKGTEASLPGVLIGAHMDTASRMIGGTQNMPGVDDDASGSSAVFEILKAVLKSGGRFKRDIYFALYAAEEIGLVGSNAMAKMFRSKNIELRGVLQYDMIGFPGPESEKGIYFLKNQTDAQLSLFTRNLAEKYLGMNSSNLKTGDCGYPCSDHASWHKQGYLTVYPFEAKAMPGTGAPRGNYNKNIHSSDDVLSFIDLDHAMKFVGLGAAFVVEMAEPTSRRSSRR